MFDYGDKEAAWRKKVDVYLAFGFNELHLFCFLAEVSGSSVMKSMLSL